MDIQGFFQKWGWFLLLGAGTFVGAWFLFGRKHQGTNITGSNLLAGSSSQPGVNGQPVVEFVPTTGDQYTNINEAIDSNNNNPVNNSVNNPVTNTNTTSSNNTTTTVPPPPPPAPAPNPTPHPPPPPPGPPPTPTPPPPPHHHHWGDYTISQGDTLSAIADQFGTTWQALYNANKDTIDAWSARFHNPVPGGPWNNIFPNETIKVPGHMSHHRHHHHRHDGGDN